MGRDALVFRSVAGVELPETQKAHVVVVDACTGELDFEDGWESEKYEELIAAEEHLGNMSTMGYLRNAVSDMCGASLPLIQGNVLGGECDSAESQVPRDKVDVLAKEVTDLKHANEGSMQDEVVAELIGKLEHLTSVAREEGNGILLL